MFSGCEKVLDQLDLFRNFTLAPLSVVTAVLSAAFTGRSSQEKENFNLETYDVPVADVAKLFPTLSAISVTALAQQLSYVKSENKSYVRILDLLTILIIICDAELKPKCKVLFKWYNFSGSGLLTEFEHSILISTFVKLSFTLKISGSIDVTDDEVNHIAMSARLRNIGGQVRFVESLIFEEFFTWAMEKCPMIMIYMKNFHRLIDVIVTLRERVAILSSVAYERKFQPQCSIAIPSPDFLVPCKQSTMSLMIIQRNGNGISIVIPSTSINSCNRDVFVKCEKLITAQKTHQSIITENRKPCHINQRKMSNSVLHDERHSNTEDSRVRYKIPSYRVCRINFNTFSCKVCAPIRLNIRHLDADCTYIISVHTKLTRFRSVEISTHCTSNHQNRKVSSSQLQKQLIQ